MKGIGSLAFFLTLTVGGGGLLGLVVETGGWFAALDKPSFNPPDFVFAPVWGTLYLLIGIAGWLVFRTGDAGSLRLWWLQLALNFCWPPLFFAAHALLGGLLIILALFAVICAFIRSAWKGRRAPAALFLPYLAWTASAALLNGAIWWLN
ncbi:TspO/MBR family protein [Jiella sp. M17.18]|uniref:TspO/MBR family protein n=1 Tax=Jiella sp. M17.18 TaxID=3234247 RepID=UPI0034DF6722